MGRKDNSKIKTLVYWWHRYSENRPAVVGLVIVAGLFILSMMAPLLTPFDPLNRAGDRLLSPA
jgi:peptide/nickel transport system permease protein